MLLFHIRHPANPNATLVFDAIVNVPCCGFPWNNVTTHHENSVGTSAMKR